MSGTFPLTQDEVNDLIRKEGVEAYDRVRRRARERGQETTTAPGRRLMTEAVVRLSKAVTKWCDDAKSSPGRNHVSVKLLDQVKPDVAALITCQIVLDKITTQRSYLSVALGIANGIEDEARFTSFRRGHKEEWSQLTDMARRRSPGRARRVLVKGLEAHEDSWDNWSRPDKYKLGMVLIELCVQETGIIEVQMHPALVNKRALRGTGVWPRTRAVVVPCPDTLDWLENSHEEHRVRYPLYLPTVEPPIPWATPRDGGYPDGIFMRNPMVINCPRSRLKDYCIEAIPDVYRALNIIQDTAWEINDNVWAVFDHFWQEGTDIAGLPSREPYPLPVRPANILEDEDTKRKWKREAAHTYDRNTRTVGKRTMVAKIHFVGRRYSHQPFYFPHHLDFRGRAYPMPNFLNLQGADLARGLLRFSDEKVISDREARDWLAIHGANCFGHDKRPFHERISWVEAEVDMIRAISEDPINDLRWAAADEPWQALAFCLEWDAMLTAEEEGRPFASKLPVGMDASNNGLQLFSLLLRDKDGARATNVCASDEDEKQDIYQEVADAATLLLERDANESTEILTFESKRQGTKEFRVADMARKWLGFVGGRLPRSSVKRSVMVIPYSGTRHACAKYMQEWYRDVIEERGVAWDRPFGDTKVYVRYLSDLVWQAIHDRVTGARDAMSWLRTLADICTDSKVPVTWTSPSGFRVVQENHKARILEIRTKVGGILRRRNARLDTDELDKKKQRDGISPNYIHSLDASIMHLALCRAHDEGIHSIGVVHDSYATHAADAAHLGRVLRETIASIFSQDLLGRLRADILASLPTSGADVPEPPELGTLDPQCVISSPYLFS